MSASLDALTKSVTVADGAWSTQLWARGLKTDIVPETANVSAPKLVGDLAREYVAAGARFICTNTFSANQLVLKRRGVECDVAKLNQLGARIAQEAVADSGAVVVGTMGPSGSILMVGETPEDELTAAFAQQAEALAACGVAALLLETFSELAEILLAVRAVKDATGLPVIASMSFDSGPQRTHTMMGAEAGECAAALDDAGAAIIGCNCGRGIADVLPAVVALRSATSRPLWVKPNAGLPDLQDGLPVYTQTPEEFTAMIPTLIDAGANVIGGCCGTGPEHIRRLAALVASRKRAAKRKKKR